MQTLSISLSDKSEVHDVKNKKIASRMILVTKSFWLNFGVKIHKQYIILNMIRFFQTTSNVKLSTNVGYVLT